MRAIFTLSSHCLTAEALSQPEATNAGEWNHPTGMGEDCCGLGLQPALHMDPCRAIAVPASIQICARALYVNRVVSWPPLNKRSSNRQGSIFQTTHSVMFASRIIVRQSGGRTGKSQSDDGRLFFTLVARSQSFGPCNECNLLRNTLRFRTPFVLGPHYRSLAKLLFAIKTPVLNKKTKPLLLCK